MAKARSAAAPHAPERFAGPGAGLFFGALCALNGAFVPAVARLTTERGDPFFVAAATTAFAGVTAGVVLAARGELGWLARRGSAGTLAVLGLLGTALPFLLFFAGTQRTSAIEAVLCLQMEPVYSLLLAWGVLGHRLTLRRLSAAALLASGVFLAVGVGRGPRGDALGLGLLMVTPLCWQLSHVLVLRRLPGTPAPVLTGARYVWGAIFLAPALWLSPAGPGDLPLREQLPILALQGVVLAYAGTMFWYLAIGRLDLARATAVVVPSIPVLSLGVSYLLLGEQASLRQLAGTALTVVGVVAFARAPHAVSERERIPAPSAPIAVPVEPEEGGDAA